MPHSKRVLEETHGLYRQTLEVADCGHVERRFSYSQIVEIDVIALTSLHRLITTDESLSVFRGILLISRPEIVVLCSSKFKE